MYYYEDLKKVPENDEKKLIDFVFGAIGAYKASTLYTDAVTAYEYFKKRNVTIMKYIKILRDLAGNTLPDPYSANHKFCNGFFPIFVKQENAFLLGNGITFNNDGTKDELGGDDFDAYMFSAGEYALWGGVSYVFFNYDKLNIFKATEFAPLWGEEDGALHAGIRFWQLDTLKPLRATLYEEDGYTDFKWQYNDKGIFEGVMLSHKTPYVKIIAETPADGTEILDGKIYPNFPIIPLWANKEHQSELVGLREKIDGYDLIQSGFANDLDDVSLIYWIINNAGGMDEVDLAKFIDQLKRVHAAVVEDDGATAQAQAIDLPYQARQTGLADIRDSLYRDAMALDTDKISAGNITATAINAAYENLELKCDGYEYCVTETIKALLDLLGIEDAPTYHRRKTTNQSEVTSMVLSAGEYLDDETILKHLPFLNIDEIDEILLRKDAEEMDRFGTDDEQENITADNDEPTVAEVVDTAEDVKGQALNGAQTQSLITIMSNLSDGKLSEAQAINMIATAIGISKDKAREIVQGS